MSRRLPHEPTAALSALRAQPSLRDLQAQERRRTAGLVQSINERFRIDAQDELLTVTDENDIVRVALGRLEESPLRYGLELRDSSDAIAIRFEESGVFDMLLSGTEVWISDAGVDEDSVAGDYISFRVGAQIRFETIADGLRAELKWDDFSDLLTLTTSFAGAKLRINSADVSIVTSPGNTLRFFDTSGGSAQVTLTDSTGGSAGSAPYTIAAVSGTGDDATINDNLAKIVAALKAYKLYA